MSVDEGKSQHHGVDLLQDIANRPEVTKRFAHFLPIDVDKTIVQPVLDNRTAACVAFALEDFCFMMWEAEIMPAAMNIKLSTESSPCSLLCIQCASRDDQVPMVNPMLARRAWPLSIGRSPCDRVYLSLSRQPCHRRQSALLRCFVQ